MRKAFKYSLYPMKPQARDLERPLSLGREPYNAFPCAAIRKGSPGDGYGVGRSVRTQKPRGFSAGSRHERFLYLLVKARLSEKRLLV